MDSKKLEKLVNAGIPKGDFVNVLVNNQDGHIKYAWNQGKAPLVYMEFIERYYSRETEEQVAERIIKKLS